MSTALASIPDVEAVASTPVPDTDIANVERLIELCSARVIRKISRGADPFTKVVDDTVTVYPRGTGEVLLPWLNVTDIDSVTVLGAVVDPSTYRCSLSGRLERITSPTGGGPILVVNGPSCAPAPGWSSAPLVVVGTHGYGDDELPDDIVLVVAELAAAKWLSGANASAGVMAEAESIDGYSHSQTFVKPSGADPAWSADHLEIIDSYRRRVGTVRVSDSLGVPVRS